MLDDPVDVFGACLKKLGYSINTRNPEELRTAQREAIEQKELLRAYINAEVRDQLVAGDVVAAQLWSTTAQQAIDEDERLSFVYPEEGFAALSRYLRDSAGKQANGIGARVPGLPAAAGSGGGRCDAGAHGLRERDGSRAAAGRRSGESDVFSTGG